MRLHKPTFTPLLAGELPQPGSLFALDAEFVAYSPPEKALLRWGCALAWYAAVGFPLNGRVPSAHGHRWFLRARKLRSLVHRRWGIPAGCALGASASSARASPLHPQHSRAQAAPAPGCRGVEVEVRPSRLGLARVSVLRGQGPAKGTACIDDYIKSAEPVYDYLTKFRCAPRGPALCPSLGCLLGMVSPLGETRPHHPHHTAPLPPHPQP